MTMGMKYISPVLRIYLLLIIIFIIRTLPPSNAVISGENFSGLDYNNDTGIADAAHFQGNGKFLAYSKDDNKLDGKTVAIGPNRFPF